MSDPNEDLRAAVSALRSELESVKSELRKLQQVIKIDEEDEEGPWQVTVECTEVVIRPVEDPRYISMIIGSPGGRGEISILHWQEPMHAAVVLGLNEEGKPELLLQGPDYKPRVQLSVENDRGVVGVLGAGMQAGAVMQAQPGGGSVAVLQPDGKARGVLMHCVENADDAPEEAVTELVLTGDASGRIKLRTDAAGAMIVGGTPGQPAALGFSAQEETAVLMIKSSGNASGACMMAGPGASHVNVFQGESLGMGTSASLSSIANSADLRLDGPGGAKAVELSADTAHTGLTLRDRNERESVQLIHVEDSHAQLSLRGAAEHKTVEMLAMKNLSTFTLTSPADPTIRLVNAVNETTMSTAHLKGVHPLVLLAETELGGTVSVRGLTDMGGQATLGGGHTAGGLVLAAGDGTVMLNLDATDHGGRLTVNNDLGFQRILMAVYEESSSLLLNHTGQKGVSVMATDKGGVVVAHDTEGQPRATLPPLEEDN